MPDPGVIDEGILSTGHMGGGISPQSFRLRPSMVNPILFDAGLYVESSG